MAAPHVFLCLDFHWLFARAGLGQGNRTGNCQVPAIQIVSSHGSIRRRLRLIVTGVAATRDTALRQGVHPLNRALKVAEEPERRCRVFTFTRNPGAGETFCFSCANQHRY